MIQKNWTQNWLKKPNETKAKKESEKAARLRKPIRKRAGGIRAVSDRRKNENIEYAAAKRKYKAEREAIDGGQCEFVKDGIRCTERGANDVHHRFGRRGKRLSDPRGFVSLCRGHHIYCHHNPAEARKLGLIEYEYEKHN